MRDITDWITLRENRFVQQSFRRCSVQNGWITLRENRFVQLAVATGMPWLGWITLRENRFVQLPSASTHASASWITLRENRFVQLTTSSERDERSWITLRENRFVQLTTKLLQSWRKVRLETLWSAMKIISGWEFREDGAVCPAPGHVGPDVLAYADVDGIVFFKTDASFTAAAEVLAELLRLQGWTVAKNS